MSFSEFLKKNGNYILTALSVAGTVASIILTAKIAPKAVQRKEELKKQTNQVKGYGKKLRMSG